MSTNQSPLVTETGPLVTAVKELSQAPVAKTAADLAQPSNQSSFDDSSIAKNESGTNPCNNNETKPPSSFAPPPLPPARPDNSDCKALPAHVQSIGNFTVDSKETTGVGCVGRSPIEVNGKTAGESGVTTCVPPDTQSKVKPTQQHNQIFATKSSPFVKVTPDPSNNKVPHSTPKLSTNQDTIRISRVNQKVMDKNASNCLTFRKDKFEDSNKKEFRKDSSNNISAPEKPSTKSTPLASNNINNNIKVSQQSVQVIKNNQQILKKNDEIVRCSNNIKRPIHMLPRKPQDILKTYGAPVRTQEDKSIVKKRCVLDANPVKRPLVNPVDATQQKDVEPAAKKWRHGRENNLNVIHVAQKSSELKVKNAPSSGECQTTKVTDKSDASEVSPTVSKSNNGQFQLPLLVERTERPKGQGGHKNSPTDSVQPTATAQRPAHSNQSNVLPKQHDIQHRDRTPKFETAAPKPDVISSQVSGSSACVRNMQSPSVPVPVAAHCNGNSRLQPPPMKGKSDGECNDVGALDLSASPRRQQQGTILPIAQTLARRHQHHCPSPAPPPLSPLSSLSPFPVMALSVRSPPPQLRIPVPQHHRSGHSQQQRPSSLSSSSPSPPADILPGCSRSGLQQQQQPLDVYPPHLLPSSALMFRQQLEMQRLWNAGKHSPNPRMEWFNDAKSIKSFDNFMKTLQQQQGSRNSSFYPYNNNTTAAPSSRRK
jgi:hypothetical protein